MSEEESKTWYHRGLKFTCTQCGDCCTGAPGYVWVNKAEIAALAKRFHIDEETFEEQFVMKVGIRKSLKEFANGDCVFFDGEKRNCTVYEDRPRQCRTWPFWDSNLRSPETWSETCQFCPGSGQGTLYQLGQIEARRSVMKI